MTFQLLEFSWKISHFFHTLTLPLSTPTVPWQVRIACWPAGLSGAFM